MAADAAAAMVASGSGAVAAALGTCSGSRLAPDRGSAHRAKPVEVQAVAGSELMSGKVAERAEWVRNLCRDGRLIVSDRRFIHLTENERREGGALDWLVRWPRGEIEIFDHAKFCERFEPMEVAS